MKSEEVEHLVIVDTCSEVLGDVKSASCCQLTEMFMGLLDNRILASSPTQQISLPGKSAAAVKA